MVVANHLTEEVLHELGSSPSDIRWSLTPKITSFANRDSLKFASFFSQRPMPLLLCCSSCCC